MRDAVGAVQVLAAAPPLQRYYTSPGQLTASGLLGGAMRELLHAQAATRTASPGAEHTRDSAPTAICIS